MDAARHRERRGWIAALSLLAWSAWARADERPAPPPARAAPSATPPSAPPPSAESDAAERARRSARRHFKTGIKLYRDADYKGALAEFEAAYRDKPSAGSLQNVALSLKALFRYAEAATALGELLDKHADELSEPEQTAVREARDEMRGLVGTLVVRVTPAQALLSIDGRAFSLEEAARGVALNVGEHTLIADAPGYARRVQLARVASQQSSSVALELSATQGFLEIESADRRAGIAVDDVPLAYHRWSGPVAPGVGHLVQVYRQGFEPFERTVEVPIGRTVRVFAKLGPQTDALDEIESTALPAKPQKPPKARESRGFYAAGSLSVVALDAAPLDLRPIGSNSASSLPSLGVHGGFRLSDPVAVELSLESGTLEVTGACQGGNAVSNECPVERRYSLRSLRIGPSLRLFTHGESFRFTAAAGVGAVRHRLTLDPATTSDGMDFSGGDASGTDAYFSLELGISYNYRHLLLGLGVVALIEGATELRGAFDDAEERAVFEKGTLPMLGVGLSVGYSAWAPK